MQTHAYADEKVEAAQIVGDQDLNPFSGFFIRDPVDNRLLLVTATHAVSDGKNDAYTVIIGEGDALLPDDSFILGLNKSNVIISVPRDEGDITIFDVSTFNFVTGKVYNFGASELTRNMALVNWGFVGSISDSTLFRRNCVYLNTVKNYGNGIELLRLRCDIPKGMTIAGGTSGSPVSGLESGSLIGMVSGSFSKTDITSIGVHSFDLGRLLKSKYLVKY